MNTLPDDHLPPAQPALNAQASELIAAVEDAMCAPTSYRDRSPLPTTGPTPPVPQPGRPPMSQRATDASALMLSASVLTLAAGGAAGTVLWASGFADPAVVALIAAAPVGVAIPIYAFTRLMGRAKEAAEAAPAEQHHHYNGPVIQDQRSINTQTRGVWASTRNQLPR
ncbi:hypothetical protein [Streptomyces sp. NPDC096351]|uniref:hypothetical protein n=1 Tax=Streptomyces sp. NPDC096351 TaxID=3366087 RepID=UPI003809EB63